jgi:hypothetical protein
LPTNWGEDVDPGIHEVANDVGVVAAHILLLRESAVEKGARLKIELSDADVVGKIAVSYWIDIRELGVAAKKAFGQRLDESLLQLAFPARLSECERREDAQLQAGILLRPPEELVDDVIGFPEPERGAESYLAADATDRGLDARFHIAKSDQPIVGCR